MPAPPGTRFVCIHGHFYQPPRENPWLEAVELEKSAYPYHDWNERIAAECYAPNAASRILDEHGRIGRIVNNYSQISFDIGPTLLAWLEAQDPETFKAIVRADRDSIAQFGRGSAMACAYSHMILPLANERDRETQVIWGLRDFEYRFGRPAEGFWLPETAVDLGVLDLLARHGVRFTVLAPQQAEALKAADGDWTPVEGEGIDPRRPYLQRLPSGSEIAVFFYDGPVSRGIAFEGLLRDGARLADRLTGLSATPGDDGEPLLVNIATDGETFGHHQRNGEMALAFALEHITDGGIAKLTNYASFLAANPATREVRIRDNTSWSCAHGIERWQSDCGCHTGGRGEWRQAWRAPLRAALDWLRDELTGLTEDAADTFATDPWSARNEFIDLILDRGPDTVAAFLDRHVGTGAETGRRVRALQLLEMQRHAMLMYTSCGWFFNDLSGIETVQILRYAGRAIQLARTVSGTDLEEPFLDRLAAARSNVPESGTGRQIYEGEVSPLVLDLVSVGAHHAVSSVFNGNDPETAVFCYEVKPLEAQRSEADGARLGVGRVSVHSRITLESLEIFWAVLHFGNFNVAGGVRASEGRIADDPLKRTMLDAFEEPDLPLLASLLAEFPDRLVSLRSLFPARRREVLERLMAEDLRAAEGAYRRLYETNVGLMQHLAEVRLDLPRAFAIAAEHVLSRDLIRALDTEPVDLRFVRSLLEQAESAGTGIDVEGVTYALSHAIERALRRAERLVPEPAPLLDCAGLVRLAAEFSLAPDLWRAQNECYALLKRRLPPVSEDADAGDAGAADWADAFRAAAEALSVAVP